MKIFRFAIALMSFGLCCTTQAAPPQYNGVFAARDPHSGAFTELERETPALHTHMRGLGFGGAKVTEDVPGARSPVRFRAGTPLEFIVRDSARENDPNSTIQFVVLTAKGDVRSFETYSAGGFSGLKNTASKSAVPFHADTYGAVYFKVSPSQPLPPGEYALMMATSPAVMTSGAPPAFCFGIDP